MKFKYVGASLVLVLASASSFAVTRIGMPGPYYKYAYHYFDGNKAEIGAKTYHCDGTVTQWGDTTGKDYALIAWPCLKPL